MGFKSRAGGPPPPEGLSDDSMPWREELTEYYAERSGLPVDKIDYYIVLAVLKLGVLLEGKYAAALAGRPDYLGGDYWKNYVDQMFRFGEAIARSTKL